MTEVQSAYDKIAELLFAEAGRASVVIAYDDVQRLLRECRTAILAIRKEKEYRDAWREGELAGRKNLLLEQKRMGEEFEHRGAKFEHHGEQIERQADGSWRLAAGGPKRVVAHPLGAYHGHDERKALGEKETDAELGDGAYAGGQRMWSDKAIEQFFDAYSIRRVVTEDAFHQALTWLVMP